MNRDVLIPFETEIDVTSGKSDDEGTPASSKRQAQALAMLLGVGFLMPWAACSNALPYYRTNTFTGLNLAFRINVAYSMPFLPLPLILLYIGTTKYAARFYHISIPVCYLLLFMTMLAVPWTTDIWVFTLLAGVMPGALSNIIQTSMFSVNSALSPDLNSAVWTGQGVAGLIASALQIIVKAVMGADAREGCFIYFSVAAAVALLCAVSYILYSKHPYILQQRARSEEADTYSASGSINLKLISAADDTVDPLLLDESKEEATLAWLWPRVWDLWFVMALNFTGTFMMLPVLFQIPYVGRVAPISLFASDPSHQWWSIVLFSLFNVGDTAAFVGRQFGLSLPCCGPRQPVLLLATMLRVAAVILFMLLLSRGEFGPANDIIACCFMLFYAFTNGFIESSAMMYAERSRGVQSQAAKQYMGNINGLFVVGGLFVGGAVSYVFTLVPGMSSGEG